MNFNETVEDILANMRADIATLVFGKPGAGKTAAAIAAARQAAADVLWSHPVTEEPTDAKGLPWIQIIGTDPKADFIPYSMLEKAINAERLTLWIIDDFGQANQAMQGAYMQLLYGGRLNGHRLSEHIRFVVNTNRHDDGAGAGKIITPALNRCAQIDFDSDPDSWMSYATQNNIDPRIRAYIRFRPSNINTFERSKRQFASERSWELLSKKLPHITDRQLSNAARGLVGEGVGDEFAAFCFDHWQKIPDIDHVIANPMTTPVPENISTIWALGTALVDRALKQPKDRDRATQYLGRFPVECAAKIFVDLVAGDKTAICSPAVIEYAKKHNAIFGKDAA